MEPTIKTTNLTSVVADGVSSLEEGIKAVVLSDGGQLYAVSWNGHEFEANRVVAKFWENHNQMSLQHDYTSEDLSIETVSSYYYPIDQRTNRRDWLSATFAYANETNTGWLPGHCHADQTHPCLLYTSPSPRDS